MGKDDGYYMDIHEMTVKNQRWNADDEEA